MGSAARVQWLVQEQHAHWKHIYSYTAWELGLVATYFMGILRAKVTCGPQNARPYLGLRSSFTCQPRAAYLTGRRLLGTGAGGFLPPRGALHTICSQCRGVLDHLARATKEKQAFLESMWLQEDLPAPSGSWRLQQYENLAVALAENQVPTALSTNITHVLLGQKARPPSECTPLGRTEV